MRNKTPLIMVVDDDWMNREIIEAYLQAAGFSVVGTHSGDQALKMVELHPPDLILLDVRMQGLDGLEVCRRLKSQEITQHIPVLLVTALGSDQQKQEMIAAGADDFIPKPLDSVIMVNRVKSLVRVKLLTDELRERQEILPNILARHVNEQTAGAILSEFEARLRD